MKEVDVFGFCGQELKIMEQNHWEVYSEGRTSFNSFSNHISGSMTAQKELWKQTFYYFIYAISLYAS